MSQQFLDTMSSNRRVLLLFAAASAAAVDGFAFTTTGRPTGSTQSHRAPPFRCRNDLATSSSSLPPSAAAAAAGDEPDADPSAYDLSLFSPCKINLFLRIIRKRPDGYHDLASLFQTVGFGDTLHLRRLPDGSAEDDVFECNMEGVPVDRTNLVLRALDLVREKTGSTRVKFEANLVKQVPAQAGLGGGSGNAAAAMFGANELLGRPATHEQLVEWSGELGSDITFFLSHGTAYCTGRGEIMTPVRAPFDFDGGTKLCIVKPDVGLSTPQVFGALDYGQLSTEDPEELLSRFLEYGVDAGGDDAYVNDLEQPAFDCLPELRELKEDLCKVKGFNHVMMSGSGTSIFCIGAPEDEEGFMADFGGRDGISVFPTEFISREEGEGKWFVERK